MIFLRSFGFVVASALLAWSASSVEARQSERSTVAPVDRHLDSVEVTALLASSSGGLFAGSVNGLHEFVGGEFTRTNPGQLCPNHDPNAPTISPGDEVIALAESDTEPGAIWVATRNAVAYRNEGDRCWNPVEDDGTRLIDNVLGLAVIDGDVVVARESGLPIEIGTPDDLGYTPRGAVEFGVLGVLVWGAQQVSVDGQIILDLSEINDVTASADGVIVAANDGAYLVENASAAPVRLIGDRIVAVDGSTTSTLLASDNELVRLSDGALETVVSFDDVRISRPTALVADAEGNAWLGTIDGVVRIDVGRSATIGSFDGQRVGAVLPGRFVGVGDRLFAVGPAGWEEFVCSVTGASVIPAGEAIDNLATVDSELFIATTAGLVTVDVSTGCRADATADFDVVGVIRAVVVSGDGSVLVASNKGLWRRPESGQPFEGFWLAPTRDYFNVWLGEDAATFAGHNTGLSCAAGEDLDDLDENGVVIGSLQTDGPSGARTSVKSGLLLGEGLLVAGEGMLSLRPSDCAVDVVPSASWLVADISVLEHQPRSSLVWAATPDGLVVLDPQRPGEFERFTVADGLPDDQVNDVAVGDEGEVWVATDRGLVIHRDAAIPPVLSRIGVEVDGSPCESCLGDGVPQGASKVTVTPIGTDLADEVRATIVVASNGRLVDLEADGFTFSVEEGATYDIAIELRDRHFNLTSPDDQVLTVAKKPLSVKVSEFLKNPLTYLVLLMAGAAAFAAFWVWRRSGRVRLVDASLRVGLVEGKPHAELELPQPVVGRLAKPKRIVAESEELFEPSAFDIEGTSATHAQIAGASLASTVLGPQIVKELRRRLNRPTMVGIRLRLELADDSVESLRSLPWEMIGDTDGRFDQSGLIVVRQITDVEPVERTGPLQVLVARSTSAGDPLDQFDRQVESIRAAFSDSANPADITVHDDITAEALEFELNKTPWDVVHLYAHGGTVERGGFVMMNSGDGEQTKIYADDLFRKARATPLLAVVAACRTSNPTTESSEVAGFAEALVASGRCRAAVGFAYDVAQIAIGDFGEAFYGQLSEHRQIDVAAAAGRSVISTGQLDQAAVRVYTGPRNGVLYERR